MTEALDHIVIVGGGTSGWMTAAGLSHATRNTPTRITLVESEEIGTIGVGEATIPLLKLFNNFLGIDELDFIRQTKASFKLGIQFNDWTHIGHSYIHPFGSYGMPLGVSDFHHYWLKARAAGQVSDLGDYSINVQMARMNRYAMPVNDPSSPLSTLGYAYHFDASLYAGYLRGYAEARGVRRIEGRIATVQQDSESGFITGVTLYSGQEVTGDFFVDCSGFRGLLIEGALKTGYEDWSSLLPCDRAVAVPCENVGPLTPYTRSTARSAGWQWRIPLQHRAGNGYVYSSHHISDDEAAGTLMQALDGKPLAEPRLVRFQTGRRKNAWTKNCVAIGLASGFLEPLESTSIHLIQKAVTKLILCMPTKTIPQVLRDEFNRQTRFEYEDVRDFLVLHYKATQRDDTDFWNYCRENPVSDSLRDKMDLYEQTGRIFVSEIELFKQASWLAVFEGQGLQPKAYDPLAEDVPLDQTLKSLGMMRDILGRAAGNTPLHAQFIAAHCRAAS